MAAAVANVPSGSLCMRLLCLCLRLLPLLWLLLGQRKVAACKANLGALAMANSVGFIEGAPKEH